jgi:branched-chain amino acid transport system ATP-binding protein
VGVTEPLMVVDSLTAGYGHADVLHDVCLQVMPGEFATIVGANGAGKSTLLKTIMGLVKGSGTLTFEGRDLLRIPAYQRVSLGIAYVPEGRRVFPAMTVEENLRVVGTRTGQDTSDMDRVFDLFPALARRRRTMGGSLSGGEQQMLAMGRAMVVKPRLLVADEITLGLAPIVVDQLVDALRVMREDGVAILLAEQNARVALESATIGYVLEVGRITLRGPAKQLRNDKRVIAAYLENY